MTVIMVVNIVIVVVKAMTVNSLVAPVMLQQRKRKGQNDDSLVYQGDDFDTEFHMSESDKRGLTATYNENANRVDFFFKKCDTRNDKTYQRTLTLKMTTLVFAKTLDNFQYLMQQVIPRSQSFTLNSSCENRRTRIIKEQMSKYYTYINQKETPSPNTCLQKWTDV
jgi:hypothetical protein